MKKLKRIATVVVSLLISLPIAAQTLQDLPPWDGQRALYALDPPISSLLGVQETDRASHLGDGLQDILHRHLVERGASFDLNDHVMAAGARFGEVYTVVNNKVVVDITVVGRLNRCVDGLEEIEGIEVLASASTPTFDIVSTIVPVNSLLEMISLPDVVSAYGVVCQSSSSDFDRSGQEKSMGAADNQAEIALDIDDLRRFLSSADGSGIEVGSLSDSVDQVGGGISDSQGTDDLPDNANLSILSDWVDPAMSDEGRAMMEHIYDIAPALDTLGFATGFGGQATMAANITALSNDGMDIINDDLTYLEEPYFQDGVIAVAVNSYVDGGGIYFSANGNYGNLSYEHTFVDTDGDGRHEFAAGDELASWQVAGGTVANPTELRLGLQWSQPWGAATTDLAIDVFTLDNPPVLISSTTVNNIGGDPLDFLTIWNQGAADTIGISIRTVSGSSNGLTIKFIFFGSPTWQGSLPEYQGDATGTLTPHAGTAKSIAIGAAPFYDRGVAEEFSSHGPHRKFFTDAGNPITPYTLTKPDFLSIDGCNTTFFGQDSNQDADAFPNFFGTSAAAPNATAVAALMLDLAGGPGTLDADDIRRIMRISAVDLGVQGHDTVNGYGRISALGAGIAAKGPLSTEFYIYLNQYGDATMNSRLDFNYDIDTFIYSSNNYGATTIDFPESHAEMNPMAVLFNLFGNTLIDVDYDSGVGDDSRFTMSNATALFPYIIEVLSESDFTGGADFDVVIDGPDQNLTNRTANLDVNGYDAGYSGSLVAFGDSDYITYTAPSTGSLFIGLQPSGFLAYIRFYDNAGLLIDHGIVVDGYSGGLSVDSVTAGDTYAVQIVPWNYAANGSYVMTADFGGGSIFSNGFESGNTSAWSSTTAK